jgi:hypothetical protein
VHSLERLKTALSSAPLVTCSGYSDRVLEDRWRNDPPLCDRRTADSDVSPFRSYNRKPLKPAPVAAANHLRSLWLVNSGQEERRVLGAEHSFVVFRGFGYCGHWTDPGSASGSVPRPPVITAGQLLTSTKWSHLAVPARQLRLVKVEVDLDHHLHRNRMSLIDGRTEAVLANRIDGFLIKAHAEVARYTNVLGHSL